VARDAVAEGTAGEVVVIEKFAVDEIVVVACAPDSEGSVYNGREVTVTSALRVWGDGSPVHSIAADWLSQLSPGSAWVAHPWSLRKRREPPDWLLLVQPKALEEA
jgi:hypothetical protein